MITERLAASEGLHVGGDVSLLGAGAPVTVTVAGILAGDGPVPGTSGRTIVMPIDTTAGLDGMSRIDIVLAAGADPASVEVALERALTTEPYLLTSPQDVAASLRASTADVRSTMALLAAISLFAAAFVILNTIAMTVIERVRELGLLRAAGATRAPGRARRRHPGRRSSA